MAPFPFTPQSAPTKRGGTRNHYEKNRGMDVTDRIFEMDAVENQRGKDEECPRSAHGLARSSELRRCGFALAPPEQRPRQRLVIFEVFGLSIINETQGLASGDQVLQEVGRWLASKFDSARCVLGRWAGNKFVVLYEPRGTEAFPGEIHRASLRSIGLGSSLGRQADLTRLHVGSCDCASRRIDDLLTFASEALRASTRPAGEGLSLR